MKSKKEIEQLAEDFSNDAHGSPTATFLEKGFIHGYTQCQEDTKQILLDFIKWSNAMDEYGNKLDNVDIDNFLNKQD